MDSYTAYLASQEVFGLAVLVIVPIALAVIYWITK